MAHQYCECGSPINPTFEDALNGPEVICGCGRAVEILYREEMINKTVLRMYMEIEQLKAKVKKLESVNATY